VNRGNVTPGRFAPGEVVIRIVSLRKLRVLRADHFAFLTREIGNVLQSIGPNVGDTLRGLLEAGKQGAAADSYAQHRYA
jgi:hypothetical protein